MIAFMRELINSIMNECEMNFQTFPEVLMQFALHFIGENASLWPFENVNPEKYFISTSSDVLSINLSNRDYLISQF